MVCCSLLLLMKQMSFEGRLVFNVPLLIRLATEDFPNIFFCLMKLASSLGVIAYCVELVVTLA